MACGRSSTSLPARDWTPPGSSAGFGVTGVDLRPGGLLAIGSWGGRDWEGTHDFTRFDPPRFFGLRDHGRWGRLLERYGTVERYDTFVTENEGWEYQFVLLRV